MPAGVRFGEAVITVPVTVSAFRMLGEAFEMMRGGGGGGSGRRAIEA